MPPPGRHAAAMSHPVTLGYLKDALAAAAFTCALLLLLLLLVLLLARDHVCAGRDAAGSRHAG